MELKLSSEKCAYIRSQTNSIKEEEKFLTFSPDSIIPPVGFLYGSPQ
jgi:hypothetical protein